MYIIIPNVLTEVEIEAARQFLESRQAVFESGEKTAGTHARVVKQNEQADTKSVAPLLEKIESVLLANPVLKAAAQPKQIIKLMVSRYQPGMHYGTHVDDAVMQGARTDLSFTLFLNDATAYDGGELVIEENDGERRYKLEAGAAILYPTTSLHHVAEVTRGERLCVVGWVRSFLRSADQREMLFDIENTIATLKHSNADRAVLDRLYKIKGNLLRMWIED